MFSLDVVPIIEVPDFGSLSAVKVVEDLKIKSQNDPALVEAKDRVYTKGFYEGKMIVGEHAGKLVQVAKPLIKEELIKAGKAIIYREPDGEVVSRSGDPCVVALCDQWYLDYGIFTNLSPFFLLCLVLFLVPCHFPLLEYFF
jgi:leucyl-tRNA synthetase